MGGRYLTSQPSPQLSNYSCTYEALLPLIEGIFKIICIFYEAFLELSSLYLVKRELSEDSLTF